MRYNRVVDVTLSPCLADSLNAACTDRAVIHHDLCTVFDDEQPEAGCSCGVPGLLRDLAVLLGVDGPWPGAWGVLAAQAA